jgi:hypothetical protein
VVIPGTRTKTGVTTNEYGFYSITLQRRVHRANQLFGLSNFTRIHNIGSKCKNNFKLFSNETAKLLSQIIKPKPISENQK